MFGRKHQCSSCCTNLQANFHFAKAPDVPAWGRCCDFTAFRAPWSFFEYPSPWWELWDLCLSWSLVSGAKPEPPRASLRIVCSWQLDSKRPRLRSKQYRDTMGRFCLAEAVWALSWSEQLTVGQTDDPFSNNGPFKKALMVNKSFAGVFIKKLFWGARLVFGWCLSSSSVTLCLRCTLKKQFTQKNEMKMKWNCSWKHKPPQWRFYLFKSILGTLRLGLHQMSWMEPSFVCFSSSPASSVV